MKEKPECHLCEQKILYLEPGMRHTECRLGYSLTEGKCVKTKDLKTNDMEKTIEIPEGYEARIEGNKVILERKESEDEKIRKSIIHILQVGGYMPDEEKKKALSYLERQKEQKPVQDRKEREYVRTLKSLIADFLRDKDEIDRGYYQNIYDWLDGRHIEQRSVLDDYLKATPAKRRKMSMTEILEKEQKPKPVFKVGDKIKLKSEPKYPYREIVDIRNGSYYFDKAVHLPFDNQNNWEKEQKPAEWSEEDNAAHIRILGAVGKAFMGVLPTKPSEEDVHWLKTLPERFNLQPKVEWSEEDEEMITRICANLEYLIKEAGCDSKLSEKLEERIKWMQRLKSLCLQQKYEWSEADEKDLIQLIENGITETICKKGFKFHFEDEYAKELVKYIKAFNPQPYWKPSKEQMKALKEAVDEHWEPDGLHPLYTLYDEIQNYFSHEIH